MVVPGRPVNFGFVKFATEAERDLAITKFDGTLPNIRFLSNSTIFAMRAR